MSHRSIAGCILVCFTATFLAAQESDLPRVVTAQPEEETSLGTARINSRGNRFNLNLKEANITDALQILSEHSGSNIVTGEGVKGLVSVFLNDVTLEEALDALLTLRGFMHQEVDGIIYVVPAEGLQTMPADRCTLETRVVRLNYLKAKDVMEMVTGMLSPAGRVLAGKLQDIVVVEDFPLYLDRLEKLLRDIDQRPQQIFLEAKILQVALQDDTSLGIQWELKELLSSSKNSVIGEGGARTGTRGFTTSGDGFFFILDSDKLDAVLDLLQEKTELHTLATPKLLALHGQEAEVIVGGKLGYPLITTTETSSMQTVEFLDIGVQLKVTPYVDRNGYVMMHIYPKVSDGVVQGGLPSETTAEVKTEVLVPSGKTVFIGGLIKTRNEKVRSQIPLLGSIPFLGAAFRRSEDTKARDELLVTITPRLYSEEAEQALELQRCRKIETSALKGIESAEPGPAAQQKVPASPRSKDREIRDHGRGSRSGRFVGPRRGKRQVATAR